MVAVPVAVNYGDILKEIQMVEEDMKVICGVIKNMPEDGLMVEWGSGGSTCKWIETLTNKQKLISIEHNPDWFNRVTRAIKAEWGDVSNKFTYHHKPEKYIQHGYGSIIEEHPCGTDEYQNPDDRIWDADVFFIDGIVRATCLMNVHYRRTKPNSVIMLHDYVGREEWYSWAVQFFDVQTFVDNDKYSTLAILTAKKG